MRPLYVLSSISLALCFAISTPSKSQTPQPGQNQTAEQYAKQGDLYFQQKQYDKAVEAYKQAIQSNAALAAGYLGLGSVYVNMGRAGDAIEPLRTAVRLDPDSARAHMNLGIALGNLRRADEALTELNEARRLAPNNPGIHNEIGNVLHNSFGRIEEALASYMEARRLNPDVPAVHHNIGLMLMRLGRFSEAIAPLEEALRLNPQYTNARYFLSDAYSKVGRYEESVSSWGKFLELVPNGPDALTKRAWNYLYMGEHGQEAAADARKFLDVHGWRRESSVYLTIVGYIGYRQAGMDQEAQSLLKTAKEKLDQGRWPFSAVRFLSGELTADALMEAAADNDKKTEAHTYIGMMFLLNGKSEDARKNFEWVKEYGNRRFYEYPLAVEELKRLSK